MLSHLPPDPLRPVSQRRDRRALRIHPQRPGPRRPLRPAPFRRLNAREGHPRGRFRKLARGPFRRRGRWPGHPFREDRQPHLTPPAPRVHARPVGVELDRPRRRAEVHPRVAMPRLPTLRALPCGVGHHPDHVRADPHPAQLGQVGAGAVEGPTAAGQHRHAPGLRREMIRPQPRPPVPGRRGRPAVPTAVVPARDPHVARRGRQRLGRVGLETRLFAAVTRFGAEPPCCAPGWALSVCWSRFRRNS